MSGDEGPSTGAWVKSVRNGRGIKDSSSALADLALTAVVGTPRAAPATPSPPSSRTFLLETAMMSFPLGPGPLR